MHEIALARRPPGPCRRRRRSRGLTPKNGRVAEPGFSFVAPGSGVIRMPPVSVCHQVSTIGQRLVADDAVIPFPGLRIDRLADRAEQAQRLRARSSSPAPRRACMSERIAVGAV